MSKRDDSEAEEKPVKAEGSEKDEAPPESKPAARDEEDDDEEEAPPPKREARRAAPAKGQGSRRSEQRRPAAPAATASLPMSRVALFVIVALAAGGAAGWFGQIQQAKALLKAESAAAPAGSGAPSGPCGAWQSKVCTTAGETSAVCAQAKGAAELLTPATCESGLTMMPATLAKVKAARKSCDSLVSKLCKDLPPDSSSCAMVKEKTPAFPSKRCDEMLEHYDEVLTSLRQLEEQGGMQMGGPGGPGGPGPGPGMGRPPAGVPGH